MQNGVGNPELIKSYFIENMILGATVWWSATLISPLRVYYHRRATTKLGIFHKPKAQSGKVNASILTNRIITTLRTEFNCTYVPDIEVELFKKLVVNTVSPVLALVKKPYPEGLSHPSVKTLARYLFEEAVHIVSSMEIDIVDPILSDYYKLLKQENSFDAISRSNLHKVSTQISVEKYGGKLSNVGELLGKLKQLGIENKCPIDYIEEVLNVTYHLSADYEAFSVEEITNLLRRVNICANPVDV